MNTIAKSVSRQAVELGRFIVADPAICHGKPTFRGSRVMVWQVLRAVQRGESWESICAAWPHAVTREAIEEALELASGIMSEARAVPQLVRASRRALAA